VAAFAGTAAVSFVVAASAHDAAQFGGGGNDTLNGHDHKDALYGNSGCDELLGRDGNDHLEGGPSGCDQARGMEGGGDNVIVWDDGAGGDAAYGGGGLNDVCKVGGGDWADWASCERVDFR
jgi:hypothetical protein